MLPLLMSMIAWRVLVIPAHVLTVAADASASSQPDGVLQNLKTLSIEELIEIDGGPFGPFESF